MLVVDEGAIRIERLELGPWATNAYIVVCGRTGQSAVIDAPAEAAQMVRTLAGTKPGYILITHGHGDHTRALAELRSRLKVPAAVHPADLAAVRVPMEVILHHGDILRIGELEAEVIHTPGHTPGSVCFRFGRYLIAGDTIFPGGPGHTDSADSFRQIVQSITQRVFVLPDETAVYPGHGSPAVLKKEKEEYAVFASRRHSPDLCGDVLWLSS